MSWHDHRPREAPFHAGHRAWHATGRPFDARHPARARFFRRVALVVLLLVVLALTGVTALAWVVATRVGLPGGPALVATLVVVCVAVLVGLRALGALRHAAFPLGAVMEAAERVAGGDYTTRVDERGPPPVRALARAFNTMTVRLQDADRQRRHLMADLAHELRTPLAVLQGRLEGLVDGVYTPDVVELQQLLDETKVLARLIDDLRTLALSDAGALALEREPVDLGGLVREVVRRFEVDAARMSVRLHVEAGPGAVHLDVDALRMGEVLANLLSNALRHTPGGGSVSVSLAEHAAAVTMTVRDTGEGMAPNEVARMFDRFQKGQGSRGSGLGLTIARNLVAAHGGEITATSAAGAGTTMIVTLPRAADATAARRDVRDLVARPSQSHATMDGEESSGR